MALDPAASPRNSARVEPPEEDLGQEAKAANAVILSQPDGTLQRGLPKFFLEQLPPPHVQTREEGLLEAEHLDEAAILYAQHVRLFVIMLVAQLLVELNFMIMYVYYRKYAILEERIYMEDRWSTEALTVFFWSMMGLDAVYMLLYYGCGMYASQQAEPRSFERFGWCALLGVLIQVVVSFFNKFNLMIFSCRLMCHMYSTFLADLLRSMDMAPPQVEE
jgi:hypothetical protein